MPAKMPGRARLPAVPNICSNRVTARLEVVPSPFRLTPAIINQPTLSVMASKIVARCPQDGIIEALEGTSPDHFVLAVQWHPERSFDDDEHSQAIFRHW